MNKEQQKERLLNEIRDGHNPICFHVMGQPLADALSEIIRDQQKEIEEFTTRSKLVTLQLEKILLEIGRGNVSASSLKLPHDRKPKR